MSEYPPAGAVSPGFQNSPTPVSEKSFVVTWLLALLVGFVGVDRFYLGKVGTGLLKLVTCGGAGVWALVDLVLVLTGAQRDKQGRPLSGYQEHKKMAWIVTAAFVLLGLVTGACSAAVSQSEPPGSAVVQQTEDDAAPAEQEQAEGPADETEPAEEEPAEQEAEPAEDETDADAEEAGATDAAGWADDTFGRFEPQRESGTGDSLVSLPEGATAGLVTASHEGSRNFSLSVLDAANEPTGDLLVNEIGSYTGTTVYGLHSWGEQGVRIQVTADGAWEVAIEPVSQAPSLESSGTGDAVYLYDGGAGALHVTHDGERNFVVLEESDDWSSMGLLVNEIGRYEGTVPLSSGPSLVSVNADGSWTLEVE